VAFGDYEPVSFLQAKGAKETGVEFHSLSKTFNMTGWRIGFAVGNAHGIAGLAKVKTNVDSGVFTAIQEAGIVALEHWKTLRDANNRAYEHRRDVICEGLKRAGIPFHFPKATFYVWCEVPTKETSTAFCSRVLEKSGVCFTPGVGFGPGGEGYFRISLTASDVRLQEALERLKKTSN
jgi:LL-diaminopimelate aminotransferase